MAVNIEDQQDMQFLNLNGTQLPASRFAQRSLREVCGTSITHLCYRHGWEGRNQIKELLFSALGIPFPVCAFLCLAHYATARGSSVLLATRLLALFPAVLAIVLLSIVGSRLR